MKKGKFSGFLFLLAFFVTASVRAQDAGASATNHHFLWKLEGKSNVVYLLGSIHLLKPENYPLAAPIETAFTNSGIAVFETSIDKMHDPETQARLGEKAHLRDGESLKEQLSPEVYAAFMKHVKETEMPPEAFDTFKPSIAAMFVEVVEFQKLGADPEYGVDQYFFRRTQKDGKQVVALETLDFQIGMVTDFSKEEGELLMKSTLKEIDRTRELYGEMVTDWQTGNGAALEKMINESMHDAPVIFKRLVTDRSKSWLPKIEELAHGEKNAIIIVGAGHLVGNEGLVELLKKKGWKVTQL
jgi:uncharacterized protein YbaP (TraB family)